MYSRFAALAATFAALTVLASACSDSSSSPASDDDDDGSTSFSLSSGTYNDVITAVPTDTCWAPPKTNPQVPMTQVAELTVSGNNVTMTTVIGNTTQTFIVTKSGNALNGTSEGDVDLNPDLNCILHVVGTFDGTMTANDAFDANQVVTLSQAGGDCSLLVGSLSTDQLDQLPCTFSLQGAATKQ